MWPCHPSTGSLERVRGPARHTERARSRGPGRRGTERHHHVLRGRVFSVGPRDLPLLMRASAMTPPPEVALPSFRFPKHWGPGTLYHGILASHSRRQSPWELGKGSPCPGQHSGPSYGGNERSQPVGPSPFHRWGWRGPERSRDQGLFRTFPKFHIADFGTRSHLAMGHLSRETRLP